MLGLTECYRGIHTKCLSVLMLQIFVMLNSAFVVACLTKGEGFPSVVTFDFILTVTETKWTFGVNTRKNYCYLQQIQVLYRVEHCIKI